MASSTLKTYRKILETLNDLRDELRTEGVLENALQNLEKEYFQKTTEKQKSLFVRKMYKMHCDVDAALLTFYHTTLEESDRSIGDGLLDDSGMVTVPIAHLQKRFGTKTITKAHLTQLREDIRQSLINRELAAFLKRKMEQQEQAGALTPPQKPKQENTSGYTKKRQAIALYVLLHAFNLGSDNRADISKLQHLLSARPVPKDSKGNTAWNKSDVYDAYSDVVNGMYSEADLDFVETVFSNIKNEDRRNRQTVLQSELQKLRESRKESVSKKTLNKKA